MDPPPLPFQLQDPQRLRRELAAAGLKDVEVETVNDTLEFRTGMELWRWLVRRNPIVEMVLGDLNMTRAVRLAINQELAKLIDARAGHGGHTVMTKRVTMDRKEER